MVFSSVSDADTLKVLILPTPCSHWKGWSCTRLLLGLEMVLSQFHVLTVNNFFHSPGRLGERFTRGRTWISSAGKQHALSQGVAQEKYRAPLKSQPAFGMHTQHNCALSFQL